MPPSVIASFASRLVTSARSRSISASACSSVSGTARLPDTHRHPRRRRRPTSPSSPTPSSAAVPGSGVATAVALALPENAPVAAPMLLLLSMNSAGLTAVNAKFRLDGACNWLAGITLLVRFSTSGGLATFTVNWLPVAVPNAASLKLPLRNTMPPHPAIDDRQNVPLKCCRMPVAPTATALSMLVAFSVTSIPSIGVTLSSNWLMFAVASAMLIVVAPVLPISAPLLAIVTSLLPVFWLNCTTLTGAAQAVPASRLAAVRVASVMLRMALSLLWSCRRRRHPAAIRWLWHAAIARRPTVARWRLPAIAVPIRCRRLHIRLERLLQRTMMLEPVRQVRLQHLPDHLPHDHLQRCRINLPHRLQSLRLSLVFIDRNRCVLPGALLFQPHIVRLQPRNLRIRLLQQLLSLLMHLLTRLNHLLQLRIRPWPVLRRQATLQSFRQLFRPRKILIFRPKVANNRERSRIIRQYLRERVRSLLTLRAKRRPNVRLHIILTHRRIKYDARIWQIVLFLVRSSLLRPDRHRPLRRHPHPLMRRRRIRRRYHLLIRSVLRKDLDHPSGVVNLRNKVEQYPPNLPDRLALIINIMIRGIVALALALLNGNPTALIARHA